MDCAIQNRGFAPVTEQHAISASWSEELSRWIASTEGQPRADLVACFMNWTKGFRRQMASEGLSATPKMQFESVAKSAESSATDATAKLRALLHHLENARLPTQASHINQIIERFSVRSGLN
jgi:hypothetical protein